MTSTVPTDRDRSQSVNPESTMVPPSLEAAAAVADSCARLMRGFNRVKNQLLALARDDVEWSSYLLVSRLSAHGPLRSSALAELLQADPSTVSRQVAAMVRAGLVERRADPADGRASLLVVTPRGEQLQAEHRRQRNEHYQRMLAEWTEDECRTFAAMTERFTAGIDQASPGWWGTEGTAPRTASRSADAALSA